MPEGGLDNSLIFFTGIDEFGDRSQGSGRVGIVLFHGEHDGANAFLVTLEPVAKFFERGKFRSGRT